jgi:hypothetical protein
MKHFARSLVTLLGVTLATSPAGALNVPACGDFMLFVQDTIVFGNGPTVVNGNVLVTSHSGTVKVGAHNIVNGTVMAANIFLGTGAVVGNCAANFISGPGKCTSVDPSAFLPGDGCLVSFPPQPLSPPVVGACVTTAPAVAVAANTVKSDLAPGCYGALRLNKGATLTLQTGDYQFKDVRMLTMSTLNGPATLHVKGLFVTESDVILTDLLINSAYATGAVVQNFRNSILTRVRINAPFGSVQPHNGMALRDCSHIVARALYLEPMSASCAGPVESSCPPNMHFADGESRTCVPD